MGSTDIDYLWAYEITRFTLHNQKKIKNIRKVETKR